MKEYEDYNKYIEEIGTMCVLRHLERTQFSPSGYNELCCIPNVPEIPTIRNKIVEDLEKNIQLKLEIDHAVTSRCVVKVSFIKLHELWIQFMYGKLGEAMEEEVANFDAVIDDNVAPVMFAYKAQYSRPDRQPFYIPIPRYLPVSQVQLYLRKELQAALTNVGIGATSYFPPFDIIATGDSIIVTMRHVWGLEDALMLSGKANQSLYIDMDPTTINTLAYTNR